jgi:hypothetical protein
MYDTHYLGKWGRQPYCATDLRPAREFAEAVGDARWNLQIASQKGCLCRKLGPRRNGRVVEGGGLERLIGGFY